MVASPYQLAFLTPGISPSLAIMTNVYPDHLNTYSGMEEYAAAKANIFRFQHPSDLALFNYDNPWTRRFGEEALAQTWFTSVELGGSFKRGSSTVTPFLLTDIPLVGKHNLENVLLATTAARLLGVSDEVIAASVRNFHGVVQRLEEIAVVDGVHFINDSTSTTPVAGKVGVEAFSGRPIVLVAGGNTKQLPLENWPAAIVRNGRDVILLKGAGTEELVPALREEVRRQGVSDPLRGIFDDFTGALDTAVSLARPGDVLLFSPGFTSFGMFLNEFDRGDQFTAFVQRLKQVS